MRKAIYLISFILVFYLIAIPRIFAQAGLESAPVYSESRSNIIVSAHRPYFRITLKSNPSTGYSWNLQKYDRHLFVLIHHSSHAGHHRKMVGVPGYESWTFRVKPSAFFLPHRSRIEFVSGQSWEGGNRGGRVAFHVTIIPGMGHGHGHGHGHGIGNAPGMGNTRGSGSMMPGSSPENMPSTTPEGMTGAAPAQ